MNTFKNKYDDLPGDMPTAKASQFGFVTNNAWAGARNGNGNGIIEDSNGFRNGGICNYDYANPTLLIQILLIATY